MTIGAQVKEVKESMHEAFFLLGSSSAVEYDTIERMEVFKFFRYLNTKKKMLTAKNKSDE